MEEELLETEALLLGAEDELLETEALLLELDDEEPLIEELFCEEVVLLEEPEERLAWEYESTGNATMAIATIDAIAML